MQQEHTVIIHTDLGRGLLLQDWKQIRTSSLLLLVILKGEVRHTLEV